METSARSERVAEDRTPEVEQPELIDIRLLDKIETIQNKAVSR